MRGHFSRKDETILMAELVPSTIIDELQGRIAKAKAILEQGRQWFVSQADIEGILGRALDALEGNENMHERC